MASKLAAQMYTLREHTRTAAEFRNALERVATIGYPAVQLSAVGAMEGDPPEVTAGEARALLDAFGLRCIATHRSWDRLSQRTDEEIQLHHTLGCDYTAVGSLPGPYRSDGAAGFERFVRQAQPTIERLGAAGVRFGYHNHDFEFQRVGAWPRTLFDALVEGPEALMLEVDVYWAAHAGVDPAWLLARLAGRIPVIHMKDMDAAPGKGPVMAAIGEGNLNWDAILAAARAGGVEWYAVEQDEYPRDPFDCLASSFRFLTSRGV